MSVVGRVLEVWRYPVKSMQGERLAAVDVSTGGFAGDRAFGVVDDATGRLLSAKTVPALLDAGAVFADGEVVITLPGSVSVASTDVDVDARLSRWLGRGVRLARPVPEKISDIDIEVDLTERGGATDSILTFHSRPGLFFDGQPMHLLTTASLRRIAAAHPAGTWTAQRFRPNLLIDAHDVAGYPEDGWVGSVAAIGGAQLDVTKRCDRCILTTRAVGAAPADREILRTLQREHGGDLGVKASIRLGGTIAEGDDVLVRSAG